MEPLIEIKNLSFRYNREPDVVLDDINVSVLKGEFVAVIGSNGAGKSTFCNVLMGLIPHYFVGHMQGLVIVDGQNTEQVTIGDLSKHIGLVFQNPFNQLSYTADTVEEELAYGLSNRGVSQEDMREKVATIAEEMDLKELLDKNPLELSGGQTQRVALASALILEPKILVLDECTTQLDPMSSQKMMNIVQKLSQQGTTVVMVDHDMERVAELADRILVLHNGKLVLAGTPDTVFDSPQLVDYGLTPPDYYEITKKMIDGKTTSENDFALTECEAIKLLQEVLINGNNS
ncbi:energy-coupling factor ABC transporter ATP-binding protein [Enterococcus canis]|nr:ABC transporter ATP-binding protein [Enterococcus canis]